MNEYLFSSIKYLLYLLFRLNYFLLLFILIKRAEDIFVFFIKNEIKAVKKFVFIVVRKILKIIKMDIDFDVCDVDLNGVFVWVIYM